ncbi:Luciferin 4-monooxygenase [Blattella germanica]|nr:Luciferin 4-monooxygenase [Blattella germanica]
MDAHHILTGPEPSCPTPNTSLGRILYDSIKSHKNKVALVDAVTGETRTFSDILSKSEKLAESILSRGVKPGDVISICSENSIDFILPVLATYYVGATCAPLNPLYTTRELIHSINISKPSIMFCSQKALKTVEEMSHKVEFLKEIIVFGQSNSHSHTSFNSLLQNKSTNFQPIDVDPKEFIAAILCSSGTTGLPKGVMLTQHNILTVFGTIHEPRFGSLREDDIALGLLPMFHSYAFACQLMTTYIGATVVVVNGFNEEVFLKSIQNYKITLLFLVPPLVIFLAKAKIVDNFNLSSIRSIRCGAAPLSEEVEVLLNERLGVGPVLQGYGMTETTLAVLVTPTDKHKTGSSGVVVPGMKCKVVDLETGEILGPNRKGELCFKGPLIMKGYCGNLQATSATFDKEGFLRTGDVGYYDEDGFFFIVDRVPPAEIEALLLTHPEIKDAGVVGIPDDIAGELPLAFVVKQPDSKVTKEEIIQYIAGQVSPQKRLHGGVEFVENIPKTASGKILRRDLKLMLKAKL